MPSVGNELNHTLDGLTVRGGLGIVGRTTTYLDADAAQATARQQGLIRAQGYYAETMPRAAISTTGALTSGSMYFMTVYLFAGETVSTLSVDVAAAGTAVTLIKLGLYTAAAASTQLAVSAESSASFSTGGTKSLAMTTPYLVTADGPFLVAFLGVAGTANPTIGRGAGTARNVIGNAALTSCGIQTGQTDMNASQTVSFTSGSAVPVWVAIS